jgi:NTE family protein
MIFSEEVVMTHKINLALQGGGSHGAYTWGVLDALLQNQSLGFEAVSGASAGAMNAVVLGAGYSQGWHKSGGDHAKACAAARKALKAFWQALADKPGFHAVFGVAASNALMGFDLLSRIASPYQFNPLNINPLRELIQKQVDFEALHTSPMRVVICATDVATGRARLFEGKQISCDTLLASACLPHVFQAVEIDGRAYWDGGYSGNPPLYPLYASRSEDILLVKLNPLERLALPDEAAEINERINEISFNTPLLQELRAIGFVQKLIKQGVLKPMLKSARSGKASGDGSQRYKRILMHLIDGGEDLAAHGAASKFNTTESFVGQLFKQGRKRALGWLRNESLHLGKRPGFDLSAMLAAPWDKP